MKVEMEFWLLALPLTVSEVEVEDVGIGVPSVIKHATANVINSIKKTVRKPSERPPSFTK